MQFCWIFSTYVTHFDCSKWHSLGVLQISDLGFHIWDLWNGNSVVIIIICMNGLHVGDKKAQQLSSARSLTQNPGAPMKQGCANLAQMDVVTIEPSRSDLTSSPHRCCVCVHEIVADYVLNITCPTHIFWTTCCKLDRIIKKDYHKQESFFPFLFIHISINIWLGSPQTYLYVMLNDNSKEYSSIQKNRFQAVTSLYRISYWTGPNGIFLQTSPAHRRGGGG